MLKVPFLDSVQSRRLLNIVGNIALVPLAFWLAFLLRFDFAVPAEHRERFLHTVPILIVLNALAFERWGLFRDYWRHVGLRDLVHIATAVTASSILFVCILYFTEQLIGMSRSVLVLTWVLLIYVTGGIRFAVRFAWEGRIRLSSRYGKRTLVIGTGVSAEFLIRQAQQDADCELHIVGLIDDDENTQFRSLHGVPVLGKTTDIRRLATTHRIELLIISVQSATKDEMRTLVDRCAATGIAYKIVPSVAEMLRSRGQLINQIRNVRIEDVLGRQAVDLDLEQVARSIKGKVVLITGAAGSIGAELTRQIAACQPSCIVMVEQAESSLYFAHLEITRLHPTLDVVPLIADIADAGRMDQAFGTYKPAFVFHAAAYKHVPLLERNPIEAVRNNVLGTWEVAHAAAKHAVGRFVLISSDKAVNPSSVMGATKRIAERMLLCATLRNVATDFRVVRFGNVLGSDGSVVPLFQHQIAAGLPVTVTHPDVRRYFMTIPEAVQLVLQAAVMPEAANRIAMLEMGEPVRILDLAEQMIRLSGLRPYEDVKVVFTGLRPGEKLDEELFGSVEATSATSVDKIRVVQPAASDDAELERGLHCLANAVAAGNESHVLAEVRSLVPEYSGPLRRHPGWEVEMATTIIPTREPSGATANGGPAVAVPVKGPPSLIPLAVRLRSSIEQ